MGDPIKIVKSARVDVDTGDLWLDCILTDNTQQIIVLRPSAISTWVQALHAIPVGAATRPKDFQSFPIQPRGSRAFVVKDMEMGGLVFEIAQGVEIQVAVPPMAVTRLKEAIRDLEVAYQKPGTTQ